MQLFQLRTKGSRRWWELVELALEPQLWWKSQDVSRPCCGSSTFRFALFFQHACCVTLFHDAPCCFWFFFLFSLNLPLDQSVCAVPVWPWQSFPCRWSSVAGSFQCAASHLNIKRWSCDIGRQESGWTSQCPSLNGWLTGRYAAITQERHNQELAQITCKISVTDCFDLIIYILVFFSCVFGQKLMTGQANPDNWPSSFRHSRASLPLGFNPSCAAWTVFHTWTGIPEMFMNH